MSKDVCERDEKSCQSLFHESFNYQIDWLIDNNENNNNKRKLLPLIHCWLSWHVIDNKNMMYVHIAQNNTKAFLYLHVYICKRIKEKIEAKIRCCEFFAFSSFFCLLIIMQSIFIHFAYRQKSLAIHICMFFPIDRKKRNYQKSNIIRFPKIL